MKKDYLTTEAERRYRKAYYERNKESILAKKKIRDAQNKEKNREACKKYDMTHDRSEYFRRYRQRKAEVV